MKIPKHLAGKDFNDNKYSYFEYLRENEPVYMGHMYGMKLACLSRYHDCADMLRDERFIRNRSVATGGGSRMPFPIPNSMKMLIDSMIQMDNPEHRRLRLLVNKAFTPRFLSSMEDQVTAYSHELLDQVEGEKTIDLMQTYALPLPSRVIGQLMGVGDDAMPGFHNGIRVLTEGMSGWGIVRTMLRDLPNLVEYTRDLIDRKRDNPGEDVLSGLIQAEEEGEKLSEDELIAMVFLLIFAGYETTVHLVTNGVRTLLQHPEQLAKLRANPDLGDSAVEEILRFRGPIHGTKPNWAREDVEMHGVKIKRGTAVMPLLGAANRDPRFFDNPEVFDIERSPNKHLGFGYGIHICLGAWLARLETRVALNTLFERYSDLELAVPESELKLAKVPFWHRHQSLPLELNA